mmetsp:Transcript_3112/g.7990  ORF Transcript_3112/g.7990 Transcript_3112/m.7990 type:complete len:202 (+) Transcript_3112:130-735(+)
MDQGLGRKVRKTRHPPRIPGQPAQQVHCDPRRWQQIQRRPRSWWRQRQGQGEGQPCRDACAHERIRRLEACRGSHPRDQATIAGAGWRWARLGRQLEGTLFRTRLTPGLHGKPAPQIYLGLWPWEEIHRHACWLGRRRGRCHGPPANCRHRSAEARRGLESGCCGGHPRDQEPASRAGRKRQGFPRQLAEPLRQRTRGQLT